MSQRRARHHLRRPGYHRSPAQPEKLRIAVGFGRYCETKLANILLTTELARRLDGTGVMANCFHPVLVATGFNRNNGLLMDLGMTILRPVSRSPKKGAETLVWLATSPDVAHVSGVYFFDQEQRLPSLEAQDTEIGFA